MTDVTVASLAALLGGTLLGDGSARIRGIADLRSAGPDQLGFVRDAKYRAAAAETRAGALLTTEDLGVGTPQIVVKDVAVAFAKAAALLYPERHATRHVVHPTAIVHPEAELGQPVEIGPYAVLGRCRIGRGTVVMAGVTIGDGNTIGADCRLHPRVVLYSGVELGNRVTVHAGTVLGSDGFGYARDGARWLKVPQVGTVAIGDDVEIGVNCTIDRGAIGQTRIGARTKIDNLCHIAHNATIGEDVAFAAGCMVAGSTVVGDRVTFAGHVLTAGHLHIAADVRIGGNSGVVRDIDEPGDYMGWPLVDIRQFSRQQRALREIAGWQARIEALEQRLGDGAAEPRE